MSQTQGSDEADGISDDLRDLLVGEIAAGDVPQDPGSLFCGSNCRARIALRLFGDALDPDVVTGLLGCKSSHAHRLGEKRPGGFEGFGVWIRAVDADSLNDGIRNLLAALTADLTKWKQIRRVLSGDIYIRVVLKPGNNGFCLRSDVLRAAALRGLSISVDLRPLGGELEDGC